MQVCPSWQRLLRQPEAEAVYAPRMRAAAPLYRALLEAHAADGMTWADAWASYCSVCDGSAPLDQLQRLVAMSLESLTMRVPEVRPAASSCQIFAPLQIGSHKRPRACV